MPCGDFVVWALKIVKIGSDINKMTQNPDELR